MQNTTAAQIFRHSDYLKQIMSKEVIHSTYAHICATEAARM